MFEKSDTAVRALIEVLMVLGKSGDSIVFAILREPRLQEMSLPISAYERSSSKMDSLLYCRISLQRLLMLMCPTFFRVCALFTLSSNMM